MHFSTLFLHWGPGANARTEKNLLPLLFPMHDWSGIDFWDQPSDVNSYAELLDAAENRVREISRDSTISIIAHSCGGALATDLLRKIPHLVHRLVLLGTNVRPETAFPNLADRLGIHGSSFNAAKADLNVETFWPLLNEIIQYPEFASHYWARESIKARRAYTEESSHHPALDLRVFQTILNDWLSSPRVTEISPFASPVELYLGADDPLIESEFEVKAWKKIYPGLTSKVLPKCGHFIHFETDPALWRSAGSVPRDRV